MQRIVLDINYRFAHRSFQEYFAVWYTCKLTDSIQYRLLTNWLKESGSAIHDSYFTMLFNMQGEKVNKIILSPGIKEIKQWIEDKGYNISLFEHMFCGVSIRTLNKRQKTGDMKEVYSLSLGIKNRYLCSIMMLTCKLNDYSYPKINEQEQEQVAEELYEIQEKSVIDEYIPFEVVVEKIGEDRFLMAIQWFREQLNFAFKILEECENTSISRKKKVTSILDEI